MKGWLYLQDSEQQPYSSDRQAGICGCHRRSERDNKAGTPNDQEIPILLLCPEIWCNHISPRCELRIE